MFVSLIARATRKTKTTVERDRCTPRKHHFYHARWIKPPPTRARAPFRRGIASTPSMATAPRLTARIARCPCGGRPPSADDARRRRRRQRRHRVPRAPSPSPSAALTCMRARMDRSIFNIDETHDRSMLNIDQPCRRTPRRGLGCGCGCALCHIL